MRNGTAYAPSAAQHSLLLRFKMSRTWGWESRWVAENVPHSVIVKGDLSTECERVTRGFRMESQGERRNRSDRIT